MSDMDKILYVKDDFLDSVESGGDIKFRAGLNNTELKHVQQKWGYIANYQFLKTDRKYSSSDKVIHIQHIRTQFRRDGVMTITLAYIIKSLLIKYKDSKQTIEINLVKSGEANLIENVYSKFFPKKPQTLAEDNRVRYGKFKPENRTKDINYYDELIKQSKYVVVKLPKEDYENLDKEYYKGILLDKLIDITKNEAAILLNKYQYKKSSRKIADKAISRVKSVSHIDRIANDYMDKENRSDEVKKCISSIADFKLTSSNLSDKEKHTVFKRFLKKKQRIKMIVTIHLALNIQNSLDISKAMVINQKKINSLKRGDIIIENLNNDTLSLLYEYALKSDSKRIEQHSILGLMKRN
ncbi:TPA: hypothetical protein I1T43_002322 [Staphylococcus aureus]|nr:hypothetical protein [Staphylococcus aureus]